MNREERSRPGKGGSETRAGQGSTGIVGEGTDRRKVDKLLGLGLDPVENCGEVYLTVAQHFEVCGRPAGHAGTLHYPRPFLADVAPELAPVLACSCCGAPLQHGFIRIGDRIYDPGHADLGGCPHSDEEACTDCAREDAAWDAADGLLEDRAVGP